MDIQENLSGWLTDNQGTLVGIACVVLAALLVTHFGERLIHRTVARTIRASKHYNRAEEVKREKTVSLIISRMMRILVWPFAIMSIIAQLGIEVAPLIAGAGIIGLALGFGAQTLVKDMIAGLFIVIENQYGVGDVVSLDGTDGLVEDITLRKTTLRDLDGIVHHIPNGSITVASNYSSEFSGINLNVGVAYDSDLEKVIKVVNEVGLEMLKDKEWTKHIIEPPVFLRVDNFSPNSVDIKITGKVQPLAQWDVTGELRKRLKVAFDKNHIEIPLPQTVIHQSKPKR